MANPITRILFSNNNKYLFMRHLSSSCICFQSAEPLPIPPSDTDPILASPKIENLVSEITKLTLIEISELNAVLKKKLNLPDVPTMSFGAIPQAAPAAAEEEVTPKFVKTNFTVKLVKYDITKKIGLIKEIKNILEDMNLVQAKKFVESAPTIVKSDINKDEAEKLKEVLEKVGAEIVVE